MADQKERQPFGHDARWWAQMRREGMSGGRMVQQGNSRSNRVFFVAGLCLPLAD
jgi:hypothetical protein